MAVEKLGMEGAAVELVGSALVAAAAEGVLGAEDDMVPDTRLLRRLDLLRRK